MTRHLRHIRVLNGLLTALALVGCTAVAVAPPRYRPAPAAQPAAPPPPPSAQSEALRVYYANVQAELLAQGLMRTDGGGADAPYTDRMLAENFIRIALFDEYARGPAGMVQRETVSRLRRWQVPVRVGLTFGASVPPERRATDTARIASYLARLAEITGHPIGLATSGINFNVYVVNEDERRALGPVIETTLPGLAPVDVASLIDLPRATYCIVYALTKGSSSAYTSAFAVIRAEHPDLLRLSCIHEELAQAMGLANDDPQVRPSIFNDDEEYALLTTQDEAMLRLLYDPALRPGMTEAEVRPIIFPLAARLMAGAS